MITLGAGTVISGSLSGKLTVTGVGSGDFEGTPSGKTAFLNLNFGLGPLDLLAGYRLWSTQFKYNLNSTEQSDEWEVDWYEVTAGVGFGF